MHWTNETRVSYFGTTSKLGKVVDNRLHAFLVAGNSGDTYYDDKTEENYLSQGDALFLKGDDGDWIVIGSVLNTSRNDCLQELERAHAAYNERREAERRKPSHFTNATNIGPVALGTYPNEQRLNVFIEASDIGDTYFDDLTGYTYSRIRAGAAVTGVSDTAPRPGTNIAGDLDGQPVNVRIDTKPAQVTALEPKPKSWRCFHCDAEFTNEQDALAHFGASEVFAPICHLSPDEIRQMEAELIKYREEDTALHRQIAGMQADHREKLKSHGDTEYAKGIRDARMEGIEPIARETAEQIIALIQEAAKPLVMTQGDLRIPLKDLLAGSPRLAYAEAIAPSAEVTAMAEGEVYKWTEVAARTHEGGGIEIKSTAQEPKTYSSGEMVGAYMGGWNDAVEMAADLIRSYGEGATPRFLAARLEGHNKSLDTQANAETYFSASGDMDR